MSHEQVTLHFLIFYAFWCVKIFFFSQRRLIWKFKNVLMLRTVHQRYNWREKKDINSKSPDWIMCRVELIYLTVTWKICLVTEWHINAMMWIFNTQRGNGTRCYVRGGPNIRFGFDCSPLGKKSLHRWSIFKIRLATGLYRIINV